MIRLMGIVLLVLLSCTNKSIQTRINDVDRIEVIDKETNFSHTDTSAFVVKGFKEVLEGPPELTNCSPQGSILFKKGDQVKLRVGYYKDETACSLLIIEENGKKTGYRLSFNTLAYLGLYFQDLKKKHLGRKN